jgi:hypothetical protein
MCCSQRRQRFHASNRMVLLVERENVLPSSGLALNRGGTRSRQYITWLHIGCSTQDAS